MARGRGGYQRPSNPAPVSGPGALSQRTDGGPSQPIREIPAEQYGDRKANADLQAAAPMAAQQEGTVRPAPPVNLPTGGVTFPTTAPDESPLAGLPTNSAPHDLHPFFRDDPESYLRALYARYPYPEIARLISHGSGRAP
jgi:hypothetical protein